MSPIRHLYSYTHSGISCPKCIPNPIFACSCMYAFCLEMILNAYTDGWCCPHSVSFQYKILYAWADSNGFWCTHLGPEVPEWVYTLFWCKIVSCWENFLSSVRDRQNPSPQLCVDACLSWELQFEASQNKVTSATHQLVEGLVNNSHCFKLISFRE